MKSEANKLILYRKLLDDKIIKLVMKLIDTAEHNLYYQICYELIKSRNDETSSHSLWKNYLLNLIIMDENTFSLYCEKNNLNCDSRLYSAAIHDFSILKELYNLDLSKIVNLYDPNQDFIKYNYFPENECNCKNNIKLIELHQILEKENSLQKIINSFAKYYREMGCGIFGKYTAFRFEEEKGIVGIENADPITFDHLIGIESQKEELIKNTSAFLKGLPSNNVLLYGDRGTGKSSSVKALLNYFKDRGLKLIELSRHQLKSFHKIVNTVKNRGQHFIIYMDDLSFEEFETDYKYLKSVLEGGIEAKPKNVLVYATSNRRHIIRESWKDREGSYDEINISEGIQEKLSLVDRFGVTIIFQEPAQKEYLKVVEEISKRYDLDISLEEIKKEALKWQMWHNGKSGRTAQQFINYLVGQKTN